MRISLATQMILTHESGVAATPDPLGGSAYLETLTNQLEEAAMAYIERINGMGSGSMLDGMLEAIGNGYIESEIAQASYRYQQRVETGDYTIVGVNDEYSDEAGSAGSLELFEFDYAEEERQIERLTTVRRESKRGRSIGGAARNCENGQGRRESDAGHFERGWGWGYRGRDNGGVAGGVGRVRGSGGVLDVCARWLGYIGYPGAGQRDLYDRRD